MTKLSTTTKLKLLGPKFRNVLLRIFWNVLLHNFFVSLGIGNSALKRNGEVNVK